MNEINLQEITKQWVEGVREYYKDTGNLTQVFMRGYFAGMSEREVKALADMLFDNNDKAPSDHFTNTVSDNIKHNEINRDYN